MDEESKKLLQELMNIDDLNLPGAIDGGDLVEYEAPDIKPVESNIDDIGSDLAADYSVVRDNAHFQQQLLRLAALKAFENATLSDAPRMMEVFATLMTQMTNNNKQILDIQKTMQDIKAPRSGESEGGATIKADNVFVGNARDLLNEVGSRQEYLRTKRDVEDIEDGEEVKENDASGSEAEISEKKD